MRYSNGPWKIIEDENGETFIDIPDGHSIDICNIEGSCGVCYANARLVRAAPEMYEFLKECLGEFALQGGPTQLINGIKELIKEIDSENIRQAK